MEGKTKCSLHGGKTPSGTESPHFRHGRYSKHFPVRLQERLEDAIKDPELISLRRQVAVLETFWQEHAAKLGEVSSAELWDAARNAMSEVKAAVKKGSPGELMAALTSLEGILDNGFGQQQAERSIRDIFQEQLGLARAEAHRLAQLESNLTAKEANVMLALVLESIRRHVPDPAARSAIASDLVKFTTRETGERTHSLN